MENNKRLFFKVVWRGCPVRGRRALLPAGRRKGNEPPRRSEAELCRRVGRGSRPMAAEQNPFFFVFTVSKRPNQK